MAGSLQRSRADLRESEQCFRALVHHASDVLTVIGADAVIRYQSPAIEQVLGYPTQDIREVRMRPREDVQALRHFEMTATDLLDDSTG
jgi:PAS domain S-box-containing protein